MNAELQAPMLEGITYKDNLPISWEVVSVLPGEGEQHQLDRINEELLQNILLREETPQDVEELDESSGREHIRRLEIKLDLLISLVTEMMTSNGDIPQQRDVVLGTQGICIDSEGADISALKTGMLLRMRLYLDPQFPRYLDICGHLIDVKSSSFTVNYCPLEARLQDLLDKLVFRRHRRAVASSRRTMAS